MANENNPTKTKPKTKKRRRGAFVHMRTTGPRRATVLGLLYPFSTPGSPATITSVMERLFDAGVEAFRSAGVIPERVDPKYLDLEVPIGNARDEILRAHGYEVGSPEEETAEEEETSAEEEPPPAEEPPKAPPTGPQPLHIKK